MAGTTASKPQHERQAARVLDADTAALHGVLQELKRVYQFRDRDRICCHDISVTQSWALEVLVGKGDLTLNELAAELYLDKSTASRVVNALERKGYVERARHPEDGRAVRLSVTKAGAGLQGLIEKEMLAQERMLLSDFDHEVRESMVQLIGRLSEAAASWIVAGGGSCCSVPLPGQEER